MDWDTYQNGLMDQGFTTYGSPFTNVSTLSSLAVGSAFQPLILDMNSDGVQEILICNGNYTSVYHLGSGGLTLADEHNFGSACLLQPVKLGDYNEDNNTEIVVSFDARNITVINYNGSLNVLATNSSQSYDYNISTAIQCLNYTGVLACYAGGYNRSHSTVIEYNPSTNIMSKLAFSKLGNTFNSSYRYNFVPPMADIDRDSHQELGFIASNYGIVVVDIVNGDYDTSFSIDGEIPVIDRTDSIIYGMIFANVDSDTDLYGDCVSQCDADYPSVWQVIFRGRCRLACWDSYDSNEYGGGDTEIVVTESHEAAGSFSTKMYVYKSDGSTLWSATHQQEGLGHAWSDTASPPVIQDVIGDLGWEICYIADHHDSASTPQSIINLTCYDDALGTSVVDIRLFKGTGDTVELYTPGAPIILFDSDADSKYEIITGSTIINPSSSSAFTQVNFTALSSTLYNYFPSAADADGDGNIDVCSVKSGGFYCAESSYINGIPSLTDTYRRSYDNPVCVNTSLRFSAKEYDESESQLAGTSYYNDIDTDYEKLMAECYGNGTLYNGSLSLAFPHVDCDYNKTGSYNVRVYLQDQYNLGDYTQYDDIVITVVSGTPGITCNTDSLDDTTSLNETITIPTVNPSTEGIEDFLDYLTGGSTKAKIFIGFMIWLLIVVAVGGGMAAITHNGMAVGIICGLAGIVGFIVLTAVGIFPVWILIILMLTIALLAVLKIGFMQAGG